MHKNNFYIFFGAWIAILPYTGIPGVWRNSLICASGIFLILVALGPSILKKLNKTKTKRKTKNVTEPVVMNEEVEPSDIIEPMVEEKVVGGINSEDSINE